jgi:small subunit ribosomal protein S1
VSERIAEGIEQVPSMTTAAMSVPPSGDPDDGYPASGEAASQVGQEDEIIQDWFTAAYDYLAPKRGQLRRGEILSVSEEAVMLDVGLKQEGIAPAWDIEKLDQETLDRLAPGEEVPVRIVRPANEHGDLIVSMSQALSEKDWDRADAMIESGEIWTGRVSGANRGGLLVEFGRIEGFIPMSHLFLRVGRHLSDDERKEKLQSYVGTEMPCKIIEAERKRRRLVMSERLARNELRKEERRLLMAELEEGQIRRGMVRSVVDFGAFVDIGGADGLVHISELAWRRVRDPRDIVQAGVEIDVKVIKIDRERERIGLSLKRLQPNPWHSAGTMYYPGQLVIGEVTNTRDFGAFVLLDSGIEGLLHIDEISDPAPMEPSQRVRRGDKLVLRVLHVESQRERISLSLKRVESSERDMLLAEFEVDDQLSEPANLDPGPDGVPEPEL